MRCGTDAKEREPVARGPPSGSPLRSRRLACDIGQSGRTERSHRRSARCRRVARVPREAARYLVDSMASEEPRENADMIPGRHGLSEPPLSRRSAARTRQLKRVLRSGTRMGASRIPFRKGTWSDPINPILAKVGCQLDTLRQARRGEDAPPRTGMQAIQMHHDPLDAGGAEHPARGDGRRSAGR